MVVIAAAMVSAILERETVTVIATVLETLSAEVTTVLVLGLSGILEMIAA